MDSRLPGDRRAEPPAPRVRLVRGPLERRGRAAFLVLLIRAAVWLVLVLAVAWLAVGQLVPRFNP
ncbi:MAG: hypothetical protein AB7N73_14915 [Gemmatimonadales bacterium]